MLSLHHQPEGIYHLSLDIFHLSFSVAGAAKFSFCFQNDQ